MVFEQRDADTWNKLSVKPKPLFFLSVAEIYDLMILIKLYYIWLSASSGDGNYCGTNKSLW